MHNLTVGQNAGQQNNNNNGQGVGIMVKVSKSATFDGSRDSDPDVWLFNSRSIVVLPVFRMIVKQG